MILNIGKAAVKAPAKAPLETEEKPSALASLFGSNNKEEVAEPPVAANADLVAANAALVAANAALVAANAASPMKKKRSRRCKCYTPKKLRAACKRMRSRRRRGSKGRRSSRRFSELMQQEAAPRANTFADMYGVPPREQIAF